MKHGLWVWLLGVGMVTTAAAQPYYRGGLPGYGQARQAPYGQARGAVPYGQSRIAPYAKAQQAQPPGPGMILQQGLDRLTAFVGQEPRPDEARLARFLDREIAPYFDFPYMARWAAGRLWSGLSPQQRRDFEGRLERMFLEALAQRLTRYDGQQLRVLRPRPGRDNEVTVGVAIPNPRGYPARLDFRFYRSADGWKVFDVSANGNSALMYYRQYFRQQRRQRAPRPGPGYYGRR